MPLISATNQAEHLYCDHKRKKYDRLRTAKGMESQRKAGCRLMHAHADECARMRFF
jgi:hypothetical protein